VADRVDASINAVKAAQREAALDRSAPDAQLEELAVCDDAMLSGRERGQRRITWPIWFIYSMGEIGHVGHGAEGGSR
jgi:hypothetical protein